MNPNAPILTGAGSSVLPESRAAGRQADAAKKNNLFPLIALGIVGVALVAAGGGAALRLRDRPRRRPAG